MKWFRLPEEITEGGYTREQVLPILNELVAQVEDATDPTGKKPDVPHIIGDVASTVPPYDQVSGRVDGGYSIDYRAGIVKFDRPQVKKDTAGTGFVVSDITLVMAYADPGSNYESAAVSTNRTKTTIPVEHVALPDLHETYIDGVSQNKTDLDEYALDYLTNYVTKYSQQNAGSAVCVGLQFHPTPSINLAIEYECGQSGCLTKVGLDRAATRNARNYKDYKAMQRRAKSSAAAGNRKSKDEKNQQAVKKNAVTKDNESESKSMPKEKDGAVNAIASGDIPAGGVCVSTGFSSGVFTLELAEAGAQGVFVNATGAVASDGEGFTATPSGPLSRVKVDTVTVGESYGADAEGKLIKGGRGFICVGDAGNGEAHLMKTGGSKDPILHNFTSGTIPANSALELTGNFTNGNRQVIKPSADNLDPSAVVFSGNAPVPAGKPFRGSTQYETKVAVSGTPALSGDMGTSANQWYLLDGNTGFKNRGLTGGFADASPFSGGGEAGVSLTSLIGNFDDSNLIFTTVAAGASAYSDWFTFVEAKDIVSIISPSDENNIVCFAMDNDISIPVSIPLECFLASGGGFAIGSFSIQLGDAIGSIISPLDPPTTNTVEGVLNIPCMYEYQYSELVGKTISKARLAVTNNSSGTLTMGFKFVDDITGQKAPDRIVFGGKTQLGSI